ncbi:MAG: hypothetical protein LBQ06_02435 [Frankiaceae bacterium]|jgi:hypothetical protein|nr:hypothetical protein [Frankiaceae bacterium]
MPDVTVTLTDDEALVLFDLLHKWEETKAVAGLVDNSEQVALSSLSAVLESSLVEPFDTNYGELVRQAKRRLVGGFASQACQPHLDARRPLRPRLGSEPA